MSNDQKGDYKHIHRTDLRRFNNKNVWRKVRRLVLVREFQRALNSQDSTPLLDLFEY